MNRAFEIAQCIRKFLMLTQSAGNNLISSNRSMYGKEGTIELVPMGRRTAKTEGTMGRISSNSRVTAA